MASRRIGGPGGGSDKGKRGGAVLAVGVVVVIGVGGVSATVSASTGSGTSASANSPARGRVQVRVGRAESQSAEVRLLKQGFRIAGRETDDATDCVGHSYGTMPDYFRRQPCVALHRAFFEVRDAKGDIVLVAASWVQMPDDDSARELKTKLDTNGTGNLTELSRDKGKYKRVRFTGDAYASRLDGTVVTNAQAQPVLRGKAGLVLTSLVTNVVG